MLLDFKADVEDPLAVLQDWHNNSNPCGTPAWKGVLCQDGWVVGINLGKSQLAGTLNPSLPWLSHLQAIHLSGNQLKGEFGEAADQSVYILL